MVIKPSSNIAPSMIYPLYLGNLGPSVRKLYLVKTGRKNQLFSKHFESLKSTNTYLWLGYIFTKISRFIRLVNSFCCPLHSWPLREVSKVFYTLHLKRALKTLQTNRTHKRNQLGNLAFGAQ